MKDAAAGSTRTRDVAALLPVLGVFLLMPPVITLFVADADVGGVPLIVVYLFGMWLALIAGAAVLARRLAPPRAGRADDAKYPNDAHG